MSGQQQTVLMTPKYRPDIDGLRAIAVMSVVLYHAGMEQLSGGYVGVDIFFVISGYLITSIIVREIENENFSITQFYERRFRRILPALTVVMVVSLAAGFFLFNSTQLIDLGKSAIATALFSSNIFFYFESGYFDGPSELKPLLHTWSLAVEEQYYIFFPLLLIIIAKLDSKKYAKWLLPIALISFVACVVGVKIDASATFYLIPTRAWELFVGSTLAINILPVIKHQKLRDLLSMTGLILITISIFLYTPETSFPGIAASIPTIGSAMIIYAGSTGKTLVGSMLSLRPVVFTGLISYSLYLWHWPVIVYTKYYLIKELTEIETGIMIFVIFVLSILSWQFVEKPFRKKSLLSKRSSVFKATSVASAVIIGSGSLVVLADGLPNRYDDDQTINNLSDDAEWLHWGNCQNIEHKLNNNQELCNIGNENAQASFIFWGDSHARALATSINLSALSHGFTGKIATLAGCPPLLSIERPHRSSCHNFNQAVLQYITDRPNIKTVILAARWALSANGTRYKNEEGQTVILMEIDSTRTTAATNSELLEIGLTNTIDALHKLDRTVILVKPVPEIGYDVPSATFISRLTGRDVNELISPSLNEFLQRTEPVSTLFANLKTKKHIMVIDPSEHLCNNEQCNVVLDDTLLYLDDDHLSTFGASFISHSFDRIFTESK